MKSNRREFLTKDQVFNTALIYDRCGSLVGMYDKLHLQKHDLKYTPGRYLNVYESDFGTFGVMICADRRWPETARTLTLRAARVIFNPTYGMHGDLNLCMMPRVLQNCRLGIYYLRKSVFDFLK
jgi:predicted amidohydrolase